MAGVDIQFLAMQWLFAGAYDENLYDNLVMAGVGTQGKAFMDAYMALYAEADGTFGCRYAQLSPKALDPQAAVEVLQPFRLSAEQRASLHLQTVAVADEAAWERAAVELAQGVLASTPNLPLAFVTWLRRQSTGEETVTYWFPRLAPAEPLLEILKRTAKTQFAP